MALVTDAQAHVWRRWARDRIPAPDGPFGHLELLPLMDEAGVDRAVLVPPSWARDGNEVALLAARAYPQRFAVMGVVSLERRETEHLLDSWRGSPGMLGIRLTFHRADWAALLKNGELEWLWRGAAAAGIPIMMYPPGLLDEVKDIALRHPSLKIIIDHLALPLQVRGVDMNQHVSQLAKLASCENVGVKASALPLYSTMAFPFADVHDGLKSTVNAFTASRVFWGSDMTRLNCTYKEAVEIIAKALPGLNNRDRESVLGRALSQWLNWPEASSCE